jgi:photosystem II stability/assembly factor-like uncharacterized protein
MATTRKASTQRKSSAAQKLALLIATRKGLWIMRGDSARRTWKLEGPKFLGQIISHAVLDPRDKRTLLVSASTGHLGPTLFRSTNAGRTFKECTQPPAFAKVPEGEKGRSVGHTFWLTPAHANEPNVWYAGTSPQGLFRTDDGGDTWKPFSSINDDPQYREWMGTVQDGTPDGPKMHSIIVDPRDPKHLYFGMSGGGVHETLDGGASWKVLIGGMEVVEGFGFDPKLPTFHDPHCLRMCPSNPDRIYQQNHCGIYRIDRPSDTWVRIGRAMPKKVGDIGFPLVVHPRNDKTAWVFPMDGTQVWPRVSPDGKPAVYVTRNAGKTWQKQNSGMPKSQGWWTVKRQAMTGDVCDPVGLYFGTTSGEVWMSRDEGRQWSRIAEHLPEIYALEAAVL